MCCPAFHSGMRIQALDTDDDRNAPTDWSTFPAPVAKFSRGISRLRALLSGHTHTEQLAQKEHI